MSTRADLFAIAGAVALGILIGILAALHYAVPSGLTELAIGLAAGGLGLAKLPSGSSIESELIALYRDLVGAKTSSTATSDTAPAPPAGHTIGGP